MSENENSARPRCDFIYTKNSAIGRSDCIYTKNFEEFMGAILKKMAISSEENATDVDSLISYLRSDH